MPIDPTSFVMMVCSMVCLGTAILVGCAIGLIIFIRNRQKKEQAESLKEPEKEEIVEIDDLEEI